MKSITIRTGIYILGVFALGLGVNILLRSRLGAGAWDTVTNNLSHLVNITLGTASAIVNFTVLGIVTAYRKKAKFLLVILPILSLSLVIDFWDILIFKNYYPEDFMLRVVFYLSGAIILTLGLSTIIITRFPAMVFDELTLILMRLFKSESFLKVRVFIELFAILLATIIGFAASIGFGAVNFGSFILAVILGPMIAVELKYLKKWESKWTKDTAN